MKKEYVETMLKDYIEDIGDLETVKAWLEFESKDLSFDEERGEYIFK